MLLAGAAYGGFGDWGRAVQCSELFEKLPVCLTVAEFFVWYFVTRIVTLLLLGLLFWLLLLAVGEVKYAMAGFAIFCGAEYLLFAYLPAQSVLNILKYFNIFTYVRISELYTNYLNINLFGYPFGIRALSLCAVIPLTAGAIFGILFVTCRKRPMAAVSSLAGAGEFLQSALDVVRSRLSLFGFECYKTLFFQRAMVLLILTALVASNLSYITPVRAQSQAESVARSYFKELEGPIGESLTARIGEIQAEIDTAVTEYEAAEESYRNGEMDYAQYDVYQMQYETAQTRQEALDIVTERVAELEALQSSTGQNPWLLNEAPYESLWGKDNRSNRMLDFFASLLMLALMSGGMAAFEKRSRMRAVIRSTPRGREKLWKRKVGVAGFLTVIVWGIHVTFEMKAFWGRYAADILEIEEGTGLAAGIRLLAQNYAQTGLAAPIQSLEIFVKFPLAVSVGEYYVMAAVLQLLVLFLYSVSVMVLADRVANH